MKLKRKKVGDRSYELVDTETGAVVAKVSKTGEDGRDNYPWSWELADHISGFGDPGIRTTGTTESLKNAVDFIEHAATDTALIYKTGDKPVEEKPKTSALTKMVRKLDARNKRTSQGYVTNRDELIAILSELTPLLSVAILEEERPYSVAHKEISVTVKLGFTLERELL